MWGGCRLIWGLLIGLFRSRATLEAENLVLRHQILVLRRTAAKRLSFNALDRLILVGLYGLFYAPKGVGALYVRRGTPLEPLIHGADHESGRRAGTESALLAVALGTASKLACDLLAMERVRGLRDHFWQALHARFTGCVVLNGHFERRLPNTLNVAFPNRVGADILAQLDGVAASTGSACHSGRVELSPVLKAMGIRPEVGMGAIRFSLRRYTAIEEIDAVVDRLTDVLAAGSCLTAKPPDLVEGTDRCSL